MDIGRLEAIIDIETNIKKQELKIKYKESLLKNDLSYNLRKQIELEIKQIELQIEILKLSIQSIKLYF